MPHDRCLREEAKRALKYLWPPDKRPVRAENTWKVFLDTPGRIAEAIEYVGENPVKEGKPRQHWSFVTPLGI